MTISINADLLRLQALLLSGGSLGGIHKVAKAKLHTLELAASSFSPFDPLTIGESRSVGLNAGDILRWIESIEPPVFIAGDMAPAVDEILAEDGRVIVASTPATVRMVPRTAVDVVRKWHVETLGRLVATLDARL